MTLAKQLYLVLIVLSLSLCAGTFAISLHHTQDFLARQLASTAQDTATSLGLSVSTSLAGSDLPTVQSMVDAVFDRGYYQLIRVDDTAGKTLYERHKPVAVEHVPQWFIDLFPLEVPAADANVMAGWRQAGNLSVLSHPGHAYDQLWRNASQTLLWFATGTGIALLLGTLLLRLILQPLRAVVGQARSICDREYPIQEKLPRTRELRLLVKAMNQVSTRVGRMFREQADLTQQLQKNAYIDTLTGVGNRHALDNQLDYLLHSEDEFTGGTLLLVQVADLNGYNHRHGFQAGDTLLLWVAASLWQALDGKARLLARISGGIFAVLTRIEDREDNTRLAERILKEMAELEADGIADASEVGHIGMAPCRRGRSPVEVLAQADLALREAEEAGPRQIRWADIAPNTPTESLGLQGWRERILHYLAEDALLLQVQPVANARRLDTWLHYDVRLRAREADGSLIPAGMFIGMAEPAGLAQTIDRRVIELAARWLENPEFAYTPLVLDLMAASVNDRSFRAWLGDFLQGRGIGSRLIFEVSEYSMVHDLGSVKALLETIRGHGAGLAIRKFGSRLASFDYLKDLPIALAKLDGGYSRELVQHRQNQVFVRAMVAMAHDLDIRIVADAVETAEAAEIFRNLNVDGLLGSYVGAPFDPAA
jgi:diguanylate cyclase (GGDEF)-like protein